MQLLLPILLSLPLLAFSAPTATEQDAAPLEKRACQTATPVIARVEEARPVESYLPGFIVSQDAGRTNRKDAFAEFTIPDGSYGCQLEAYFPASYPIQSAGKAQVYVYSTDKPLTYSGLGRVDVSWAYSPAPVSHVGTVVFRSSPSGPTRVVINSFQCKPKMTYRFKMSVDDAAASSVSFDQNAGAGLRMLYNC